MCESCFACKFFAASGVAMTVFSICRSPAARHETWGLRIQMMWRHLDVVLEVAVRLGVVK